MLTTGFVDLAQVPDILTDATVGVPISVLHTDGTWEPMVIESQTEVDSQGFSVWRARLLWISPTQVHRLENQSAPAKDGFVTRQYQVDDKDIERARQWRTAMRTLRIRIRDGQVTSPSHVRVIVGAGYHQRAQERFLSTAVQEHGLQPLGGVPLNLAPVREDEWFHGTFRPNWLHDVTVSKNPFMVHLGTNFAAAERILDIGKNNRLKKGTEFYVYRMRLSGDARVHPELIRDMNEWARYWDVNYHDGKDAFVYLNDFEQKGSSSIYARADKLDLVDMETYKFYPEGLGFSRDAGRADNRDLNTSRFRMLESV